MAASVIHDLFDGNTYHIIADSTEIFRMSLFDSETGEPIDLSNVDDIEWFLGPASVKNEYAEVEKSLSREEVKILKNQDGSLSNTIQIILPGSDTKNFQGGYIHQILITDGDGVTFRPMQGLLVFSRALLGSK